MSPTVLFQSNPPPYSQADLLGGSSNPGLSVPGSLALTFYGRLCRAPGVSAGPPRRTQPLRMESLSKGSTWGIMGESGKRLGELLTVM